MSTPNERSRGARDNAPRGERGDYDKRGGQGRREDRDRRDDRPRGGYRDDHGRKGRDDRRSEGGGRDDRDRGGFQGGRDDRDRGGFRGDRDQRGDRGGRDFRGGDRDSRGGRDFRDRDDRRSYGDRDSRDSRGAGDRSTGRGRDDQRGGGRYERSGRGPGAGRDDRDRGGFRGDRDDRGGRDFRDRDDRRSHGDRDNRGGRDGQRGEGRSFGGDRGGYRGGRDDRGRDDRGRDDRRSSGGGRDDRRSYGDRDSRDSRGAGDRSTGRGRDDQRGGGRYERSGRGPGVGRDDRDRGDSRGGRDKRSNREKLSDRDKRRALGGERGNRPAPQSGAPASGPKKEGQLSKAARERLKALRADYDPNDEDRVPDEDRDTYTDVKDGIRLQKALAAAGVASRRASEEMIAAGRVSVDGQVVRRFGARVNPETSEIRVDDMRVVTAPDKLYFALNKPRGVVSTMWDPEGRPTLADYTGQTTERIFHVGRLDTETEGLILLTNDGELANRLTHPRYKVVKTYIAKVPGPVPHRVVREVQKGVELEDGPVEVDSFRVVENEPPKALVEIRLHEGRKHIVRRLMEAVGHPVADLARTQVGPIDLNTLKLGTMRALTSREVSELYEAAGL
ncbi:23S rRNA pseudouridine2605 synthase [Nocardiopsis arvandica]|uniref:Pseudouridine synthase n=1 Tax=Nocardiopsis sinuspersici TaxID=501010 RepID=A0A7Y9XES2_9ACTN|nr:23S rRNA pseudouridine2605 synthase [Nocardiopsis sinuspersici]